MQAGKIRKKVGYLLVATILGISLNAGLQGIISIPDHERFSVGDRLEISRMLPQYLVRSVQVVVDGQHFLREDGIQSASNMRNYGEAAPVLASTGHFKVNYMLFGLIPLRKVDVDVVPEIKLLPGGQSIGVMLQSHGVIVVGQAVVVDQLGNKTYPAREAGIRLGDLILSIDGKEVKSDNDVAQAVHQAGMKGQQVQITVKRGSLLQNIAVKPVFCQETKRYRIGLYVRDSAAGVGTLTFFDPESGKYGALGHVINDIDTNQKIEIDQGQVIGAAVQSIQPGRRGQPGEKIGSFLQDSTFRGTIDKNTPFGIFGSIQGKLTNSVYNQPMPIATESTLKEGPAKILTVISGEKVEAFDITIERVLPQRSDSKNMVIRITDPRLLSVTGGIVQGMSGSPIIQNDRIVGAVTHVFVNDPTRGYGVFIEQMLKQADIPRNKASKDDAA
ncbi:MAG TPA: SpoIVB peptidase [Desulfobacteria bacterium]|nr:SpoIVB peptidase [Desulfobacteria bacterium]